MAIVIIGSGFAGASCAWWLTRLGAKDVVVLEREEMPGIHASGLNAGMARAFEEDEEIAPLAKEGVEFICDPPEGFTDKKLIECSGSLLLNTCHCEEPKGRRGNLVKSIDHAGLLRPPRQARSPRNDSEMISKELAIRKNPYLATAKFDNALWTPKDGIIDIHSYLWAFINGAKLGGAKFLMGRGTTEKISNFKFQISDGRISNLKSSAHDVFKVDVLVNATGAWAPEVAKLFGAESLDIRSYRRHLFCTPPMPEISPKLPFVWDVKNEYYFRPESGGLLLGACDEEEVPVGVPPINPRIRENLAEKLTEFCPQLANISIAREWCGLRTFAKDRRPVIGWDKKVKNFFWLTALGGRGVTCAASVGKLAAMSILKYADQDRSS